MKFKCFSENFKVSRHHPGESIGSLVPEDYDDWGRLSVEVEGVFGLPKRLMECSGEAPADETDATGNGVEGEEDADASEENLNRLKSIA